MQQVSFYLNNAGPDVLVDPDLRIQLLNVSAGARKSNSEGVVRPLRRQDARFKNRGGPGSPRRPSMISKARKAELDVISSYKPFRSLAPVIEVSQPPSLHSSSLPTTGPKSQTVPRDVTMHDSPSSEEPVRTALLPLADSINLPPVNHPALPDPKNKDNDKNGHVRQQARAPLQDIPSPPGLPAPFLLQYGVAPDVPRPTWDRMNLPLPVYMQQMRKWHPHAPKVMSRFNPDCEFLPKMYLRPFVRRYSRDQSHVRKPVVQREFWDEYNVELTKHRRSANFDSPCDRWIMSTHPETLYGDCRHSKCDACTFSTLRQRLLAYTATFELYHRRFTVPDYDQPPSYTRSIADETMDVEEQDQTALLLTCPPPTPRPELKDSFDEDEDADVLEFDHPPLDFDVAF